MLPDPPSGQGLEPVPDMVEARLDAGEDLHMSFGAAGRQWWFNDAAGDVDPDRVRRLGNRLVECGDSLFGWPEFSQTWKVVRD